MPPSAPTVVGGIISFPIIQLIELCFSAHSIIMLIRIINFAFKLNFMLMTDLNRIKVILVEKKRTNKWLAEELGKDPATVSKWCTNTSQPDIYIFAKIADLLEVDIRDLLIPTKKS